MFAIRQIIEDPQDSIPVPSELRHRRTEVIFIPLDQEPQQPTPMTSQIYVIEAFRGKGGAAARLLTDRQADYGRER